MVESHRSLAEQFETSTPTMDRAVEHLCSLPGVHGARMTGGGFGGCVVAIAEPGSIEPSDDTWIVRALTDGALHVTDTTNAGVTGLTVATMDQWDDHALAALGIPRTALATIVDSAGIVGPATALPGAPPRCVLGTPPRHLPSSPAVVDLA